MPEGGIADYVSSLMPELKPPDIPVLDPRDHSLAGYSCEVIMKRIKQFEDNLDTEHEVAIKLASFGYSVTMSVTDIGYSNPSTLVFRGYVDDQPATLIQHMSQLNFLLLAVKKADPEKPAKKIGFALPTED